MKLLKADTGAMPVNVAAAGSFAGTRINGRICRQDACKAVRQHLYGIVINKNRRKL